MPLNEEIKSNLIWARGKLYLNESKAKNVFVYSRVQEGILNR